jgi:hypothetical protein
MVEVALVECEYCGSKELALLGRSVSQVGALGESEDRSEACIP